VFSSQTSLVGTWELLSREDVTSDGQRRVELNLGSDPVTYLMCDATGHFSVQLMRRNRKGAQAGTEWRPAGGANNRNAVDGYDAYFGRYSVGADGTVTQWLVGALSPRDVGKVVTRQTRVHGNELIVALETASCCGKALTRTLRRRRLA
jgi:hypothetical protein